MFIFWEFESRNFISLFDERNINIFTGVSLLASLPSQNVSENAVPIDQSASRRRNEKLTSLSVLCLAVLVLTRRLFGSCTHLPALTLQPTHTLLAPLKRD